MTSRLIGGPTSEFVQFTFQLFQVLISIYILNTELIVFKAWVEPLRGRVRCRVACYLARGLDPRVARKQDSYHTNYGPAI